MRYDEEKEIYRDCRFCHGRGCLACKSEADKAYKKAFPDGPKPIATFRTDNPEDMEKAKKTISQKALEEAFKVPVVGELKLIKSLIENKCYGGENLETDPPEGVE